MSMLHGIDNTPGNIDILFAVSNNNGTSFGTSNKLEQQYWIFFQSTNSSNQVTMSMLHGKMTLLATLISSLQQVTITVRALVLQ